MGVILTIAAAFIGMAASGIAELEEAPRPPTAACAPQGVVAVLVAAMSSKPADHPCSKGFRLTFRVLEPRREWPP